MAYITVIRNGTNAKDVKMNMNSPKNILKKKKSKINKYLIFRNLIILEFEVNNNSYAIDCNILTSKKIQYFVILALIH